MDLVEKAKIRITHWIDHNEHHREEYDRFAAELEEAGQKAAAEHIRGVREFADRGAESLRKALNAIEQGAL